MVEIKPSKIGELSRQTGCGVDTIRYYERIGLLPPPRRQGRYRQYGAAEIASLAFIRRARDLGFTLQEIRALLRLHDGEHACHAARSIAASHLVALRQRIAALRAMERALAGTIRQCGEDAEHACPLIEALSGPPGGG